MGARTPAATLASSLRSKPLQRIVVRGEQGSIQIIPAGRVDYVEADDDAILIATAATKVRTAAWPSFATAPNSLSAAAGMLGCAN